MTTLYDKYVKALEKYCSYLQDYMEVGYNQERLSYLRENMNKAEEAYEAGKVKLARPIGVIS